jgi:hypothetical protein
MAAQVADTIADLRRITTDLPASGSVARARQRVRRLVPGVLAVPPGVLAVAGRVACVAGYAAVLDAAPPAGPLAGNR